MSVDAASLGIDHPGQWIDCYAVIDGERKIVGYSLASSPATTSTIEVAVKESDNPVTEYVHGAAR